MSKKHRVITTTNKLHIELINNRNIVSMNLQTEKNSIKKLSKNKI